MTNCKHFRSGICGVASELAGRDCFTDAQQCRKCTQQSNPQAQNRITLQLASAELIKSGHQAAAADLVRKNQHLLNPPEPPPPPPAGGGVGSEIKKRLGRLGIHPRGNCNCNRLAIQLNDWGVDWCHYNLEKILDWLAEEARERRLPFIRRLARGLVRAAIRKAAADQPPAAPEHPLPPGVTSWAVGITAAPRPHSQLARTVNSLRRAGFEPTIYAEPGTHLGALPHGVEVVKRPQRLGCWRNYVQTLRDLHARGADAVFIVQDDMVVARGLRRFLERDLWPSTSVGAVSVYCPNYPAYEENNQADLVTLKKINHRNLMGACGLIYPQATAGKILEHPLAENWKGAVRGEQPDPVLKKATDAWVGHVVRELGLSNFYYHPSLMQHIAPTSAVGHGGHVQTKEHRGQSYFYRKSIHWRGQETTPQEIWRGNCYWGRWTLPAGHLRFRATPATTPPRVITAVIPGRGLPELAVDCLRHLEASTVSRDVRAVYVEDGHAPDWDRGDYREICRLVKKLGGEVHALGEPAGYTPATNAGIQLAQESNPRGHVLLLNNDAQVGPHCLERLRWHLERHERAAAVGPLTGDHGRQSVRRDEIKKASRITRLGLSATEGDAAATRGLVWEFDKLSGFCLMVHGDALAELGPLAVDGYPLGLGTDDEWIRRANRAGWRTFLAFDAWASHQHHQTFNALGQSTARREASRAAFQTLRRT